MSEVWSVPGYELQALLGSGATGEVWRARQLATGAPVALRRLPPGLDAAAVAAVRREAALLAALDTPYVVRLCEVVEVAETPVLVLEHAVGGSLAALLARRSTLDAGEVVTVGGPLAQALAAVHALGLSHGGVTPGDVLFTAEGMPQLSDVGLRRLVAAPAGSSADASGTAADVRSLAALCHHMLAGAPPDGHGAGAAHLALLAPAAPRALVAAVEAGLAPDPADRPGAAAFADLLRRSCAAAPVRLAGGRPSADAPPSRRRRASSDRSSGGRGHGAPGPASRQPVRRHAVLGGGLVLLVAAAGAVGWLSGRGAAVPGAPAPLPPVPSAAAAAPDWASVLDRLDGVRAQAFADGDVAALSEVYAAGSAGLASDTALVRALADGQQTATGVRHSVRSVAVLASTADTARLRVVDVLSGYAVRGPAGQVVTRTPERGPAPFLVELSRVDGDWRLVEVRPAPDGSAR